MSSPSLQPILALLGHPVAGNPSQYLFEKAFVHHELDWRFLSLEVAPDDLGDAVRGMRAMGFHGGTCADPHKQAVAEYLDRLNRTAEMAGTVNCILREDGLLIGENTEGKALLESLRRRIDPAGKRIVLLGAGHVAQAIGIELARAEPAEIVVVNRSEPAGRQLLELLGSEPEVPASLAVWEGDYQLPGETHVLINATSIGREDPDARVPLNLDGLAEGMCVADVTSNPPQTWLLREAAGRGCETIDGLEIFIEQAVINFKLWTGVDPDPTVMHEAVEEFLGL